MSSRAEIDCAILDIKACQDSDSGRFRYRYIGDVRVAIRWAGTTPEGRERYEGWITIPNHPGASTKHERWAFDDVCSGVGGVSTLCLGNGYGQSLRNGGYLAVDHPAALDIMAETALSFAAYYTTHNRGDDVPEWAPRPELADAFDESRCMASTERGVLVNRSVRGPAREVLS